MSYNIRWYIFTGWNFHRFCQWQIFKKILSSLLHMKKKINHLILRTFEKRTKWSKCPCPLYWRHFPWGKCLCRYDSLSLPKSLLTIQRDLKRILTPVPKSFLRNYPSIFSVFYFPVSCLPLYAPLCHWAMAGLGRWG